MRWEADLRNHYHVHGQRLSLLDREGLPSGWLAEDQQIVNVSSYAMKLALANKGSRRGQQHQGNLGKRASRDGEGPSDKGGAVSHRKATDLGALDDVTVRNNTKQRKRRRKKKVKDTGVMATVAPDAVAGGGKPRLGVTEKLVRTLQPTVKVR
ncbi:unnamed protein product [Lymnaea stagnalis]|uniref:Uncharacterized protein n=1 Tax=Lymnaea stagnalis TaxID=6523 RepID=A0AAV2IRD4_LYMST